MLDHPNALMTRENAGLCVQLAWLPVTDIVGVQCSVEDVVQWVTVDKEQALDAFHHPMVYLAPAQVAELFPRRVSEDVEDEVVHGDHEIPV